MKNIALLAEGIHQMWYALPVIVSVSLVYAGTRHEYMIPILVRACKFGAWICTFMAAILVVLAIMSWVV